MTVKELIAALAQENPDRIVILQSDGGNGFSPLSMTWSCGRWGLDSMEVFTPEDIAAGYGEDEELVPALILVPTN